MGLIWGYIGCNVKLIYVGCILQLTWGYVSCILGYFGCIVGLSGGYVGVFVEFILGYVALVQFMQIIPWQ